MATKHHILAALLTPLAPSTAAASTSDADYVDEVCKPTTTSFADPIPPCVEIETIETACAPNGTEPIHLAAHAECMCGGSYFAEWNACQDCLAFHGQRTERDGAFFKSVVAVASHSLCDFLSDGASSGAATPKASFAAIFSGVKDSVAQPTTGATVSSDRAVSETAVSLYYTPSGSQGPGLITGAAATATGTTTRAVTTTSATASSSGAGTTAAGSESSTSSSTAGAQPTKAAGGLLFWLAGLAVAAALQVQF